MNDVPNDPIARVAQRWAAKETERRTLEISIRSAADDYLKGRVPEPPGDWLAAGWADEHQRADFTRDINRAVAEWLRGVANELDPRRGTDWITETEPPERAPCLVLDDAGDVGVGFWEARTGWHGTDDGMSYDAITHWACIPLPEDD